MHLAQGQNKISAQYMPANTIYTMIFNLPLHVPITWEVLKTPKPGLHTSPCELQSLMVESRRQYFKPPKLRHVQLMLRNIAQPAKKFARPPNSAAR